MTLFSQIYVIGKNVVIENLRNRTFLFLNAFGAALLLFSVFIANWAVGDSRKVIQDYSFWVMGIWGLVVSLFFGINIIRQELQQKTIYLLMCRPVSRAAFVLGKFTGILTLNIMIFLLLSSLFGILITQAGIPFSPQHLKALICIFIEWDVLAAFSLLFAALTSPVLHVFFLFSLFVMGHWSKYLYMYSHNLDPSILKNVLAILYRILPNLEVLNFRDAAVFNEPIGSIVLLNSILVGLLWATAGIGLTMIVFKGKRLT